MIGPHIMGSPGEHRVLIQQWQPRALLLLDPGAGAAADIKRWSPGTFVIGRVYRDDGEVSDRIRRNPGEAAQWAADLVRPVVEGNPDVDVWQFNNEILQSNPEEIALLAQFSIRYIELLAARGLRAAIGCFSVGNPEAPVNDQGAAWKAFAPAMKIGVQHNAVLLLHAYGRPHIFGDPQAHESDPAWYLQRYEHVVRPFLPPDVPDMPYVYGEYGCDMRGGDLGWKTGYGGDFAAYVSDLNAAAQFLAQQPNCLGACVFTLGVVNPQWLNFDIRGGAVERLARISWPAHPKGGVALHPRARRRAARTAASRAAASPGTSRDLRVQASAFLKDAKARPLADYSAPSDLLRRIVADGFVPTSREFTVRSGGITYRARVAAHPQSGEERVYYAPKEQPADVRHVVA